MANVGKFLLKGFAVPLTRRYTSAAKLVDVTVNDKSGIATVSMNRPPVNGMNLELCSELTKSLEDLQSTKCRGIILTSSLPTIFSGGLDIMEMYKPDIKRATDFWHSVQDLWLALYGCGVPTAAAINGASPAGGCLLALSCEYRVFVGGKFTIGLNETILGIVAPKWFQDSMMATIGHRQTELALLRGTLFSADQALSIGLVDELATDKADAITKCEKYIDYYAKMSPEARKLTKLGLRKDALTWLEENRDHDTQIFLSFLDEPKVQEGLGRYIQSLKRK